MKKELTGQPYRRPYRFVIAPLYLSITFCAMLPYISPSIYMGDIMQTFGCDLSLAGLSMTMQLVIAGICFFVGSIIMGKIGMLRTCQLSIWSLLVGCVLSAFAPNIYVFLVARAIAGFGQGLSVGLTPFLTTWFKDKEQSMMITFNGICSAIALALSVALCRPLANALGTWQTALLVYAAITLVFALGWTFLGRMSPEGEAQEAAQKEQAAGGKQQSGLSLALKQPQFWKVMVYAGLFIVVDTARATFLPTYMIQEGISETLTTTATSLLSIFGMIGSLLGGILVTKLWARKPLMYTATALYAIAGLALTIIPVPMVRVILCIALGFIYYIPITAQSTLIIEYSFAIDPRMISGGIAMASGVGMLLTLIVSPIFSAITAAADMTTAFRIFFAAMFISSLVILTAKETGRKPERK